MRCLKSWLATGLLLGVLGWIGTACDSSNHAPTSSTPGISKPAPGSIQAQSLISPSISETNAAGPLFEKLDPSKTGIDFVHQWRPRDAYETNLLRTGFTGGGVCLGDYDLDGLCDIYLTRPHGGGRLYRNLGGFKFRDATREAGLLTSREWPTGAAFADVNNDGLLDLFVCSYLSGNHLYLNQGNGGFKDITGEAGLQFQGASVKMAFADFDLDGDLDGFLVTNRREPRETITIRYVGQPGDYGVAEEHLELAAAINLPNGRQQFVKAGQLDRLYRNELAETGTLRFTDISQAAGIEGYHHGLDVVWWDDNLDGYPDLYVANDFTDPDRFYRNNQNGTFTEISRETMPHTPWSTMGCAVGDFNGDGLFDLFTTDMAGTSHLREIIRLASQDAMGWFLDVAEPRQYMRNALLLNAGTGRFLETAYLSGVARSDWTWSAKAADFDNDGREDIFVSNGFTRDFLDADFAENLRRQGIKDTSAAWNASPPLRERNILFRNLGNLQFTNAAPWWGLGESGIGFGAALGDLDNDGRLDLVVNNFQETPSIYRQRSTSNHWVKIRLHGLEHNQFGIGATVRLQTRSASHMRYLNPGIGYMSSDELMIYCGLGEESIIHKLTIDWPSGRKQSFTGLKADQFYTIAEPKDSATGTDTQPTPEAPPLYSALETFPVIRHEETPFNDYRAQPLLPGRLSQLGPGMAWGDIDGDGLEDLYLSGSAGHPGQLLRQTSPGAFVHLPVAAFVTDAEAEDMGCLFFDADADGDPDLFVASGGVESPLGSPNYRDRLYINQGGDGNGPSRFKRNITALPDFSDSTGPVAAADFDRDGDLDLLVGGRLVPGQYPTPPISRLYLNEKGHFTDATAARAPGLGRAGMVTGVLWSDADGDGWMDLLCTVDHGPVRIYQNRQGRLVDSTADSGLADLSGWWQGIAGADMDHDGDIDYAVSNYGRNTKIQVSPEQPHLLLHHDFGQMGRSFIIEAQPTPAGLRSLRGRGIMTFTLPFLAVKFPTVRSFARATLPDMFSPSSLHQAFKVEANTAESGLLINDGSGHFTFRPLPLLAQVAPSSGIAFLHANEDAHPDLFLAQNCFSPNREVGRQDGGLSLLLLGKGDGTFHSLWPKQSGLDISGDAKATAVTDLNQDGWQDLVVAQNDDVVRAYVHAGASTSTNLTVRVQGKPGNPRAIGARVRLFTADGPSQTVEIYAGQGYLSQSPPQLSFGSDPNHPPTGLEIIWPQGNTSRHPITEGETTVEINEP